MTPDREATASVNEQQTQDWAADAEQQVRDVLASYRSELRDRPGDEDLIGTRQVDSLTFVSILTGLIDRSGRDVDLDRIGGTELRTIAGLARVFYGPAEDQTAVGR
jgi:acyl carrier protein